MATLQDTLPRRPAEEQLTLPLPPAPKIKRDVCRYCHGIHMNVADFIACREANT